MQTQKSNTARIINATVMTVALGLLTATSVQARPIQVNAVEDSAQPGFFTLDFGGKVGTSSGQITSTDYGLQVDPDTGTAELTNYYQEVESLNLFGVPTGAITVSIVPGSSTGTYNKATREFSTSELYSVSFTADLSAFGLFSPVELPSTSTGIVDLATGSLGSSVNLQWVGTSDVIPGQEFAYNCEVNTKFTARTLQVLDIGLQSAVLDLNLSQTNEDKLIGPLDMTSLRLRQRNLSSAARNLNTFISRVEGFKANFTIIGADADAILEDARFVLRKITPRTFLRK